MKAISLLLLVAALLPIGAEAQNGTSAAVLDETRIVALGEAAEADCAVTLQARCLATIAYARIAAGQGRARAVPPTRATATVIDALQAGNHGTTLRSLLVLADAVRRLPASEGRSVTEWDTTTKLRAGQVAEIRAALDRQPDPARRADALRDLALRTLDPLAIAAAVPAAEAHPDEQQRRIGIGWAYALALAVAGDREGLKEWLEDLAAGPDFTDEANGVPRTAMQIQGGDGDSFITDGGSYLGPRNLPRLAAYAWAALGDGAAALAAADRIRWVNARIGTFEVIGRYRGALQPAADARIVAIGEAHPDEWGIRQQVLRAMIRLSLLEQAEQALMALDARETLEGHLPLPRLLAAALGRAGDQAGVDRVAAWAQRLLHEGAEAERRPRQRQDGLLQADEARMRVRLAGLLAQPSRHREARAILAQHASPAAVEACVAEGGNCLPLVLLVQAIREVRPDAP